MYIVLHTHHNAPHLSPISTISFPMFLAMGAEATVELRDGMIIKKRLPKGYALKPWTAPSGRGVLTPIIYDIKDFEITMAYISSLRIIF